MKKPFSGKTKLTSLAAALLGWLLLSSLNLFVMWALRDRARLIRDNDNERTMSTLFAEMRGSSDLGAAIETNPALLDRIKGAAIYENDLLPLQQWGTIPPVFNEEILQQASGTRFGRYTIPDRQGRSVKFVFRFERFAERLTERPRLAERLQQGNPPEGRPGRQERRPGELRAGPEQGLPFLPALSRGRYFYTDISHPVYWRTLSITAILFPLIEIILLFLVLHIRHLYIRNREYREKIDAQQNLVVLGAAAGTLAHEIKNPLLSIRLQTGIIEKISGSAALNEISIINQEVDRLSSLVYRVNDYLREPAGIQAPVNMAELAAQATRRIIGLEMPPAAPAMIFADEARIRSVLENVLRNSLESGSPVQDINVQLTAGENTVTVTVSDRGSGVDEKNIKHIFDLFYTNKSMGTGIGLAISRRFTEAAGGSIHVENRKGGGLALTIAFPRYNGEN